MRRVDLARVVCLAASLLALSRIPPVLAAVYGAVEIATEPDTRILWDGIDIGSTDEQGRMTISGAPVGTYTIVARKQGFETRQQVIEVGVVKLVLELPLARVSRSPAMSPPSPLQQPASEPAANDTAPEALPDPFARRASTFHILLTAAVFVIVAVGVFYLLGRRREPIDEVAAPAAEAPHLAFGQPSSGRRPPGFYEELREREVTLEGLEERGSGRPAPKVVELRVSERPSGEEG